MPPVVSRFLTPMDIYVYRKPRLLELSTNLANNMGHHLVVGYLCSTIKAAESQPHELMNNAQDWNMSIWSLWRSQFLFDDPCEYPILFCPKMGCQISHGASSFSLRKLQTLGCNSFYTKPYLPRSKHGIWWMPMIQSNISFVAPIFHGKSTASIVNFPEIPEVNSPFSRVNSPFSKVYSTESMANSGKLTYLLKLASYSWYTHYINLVIFNSHVKHFLPDYPN